MAKKRILMDADVITCSGVQTFYADAETPEEALQLFREGKAKMYSSEVEVTHIGPPEVVGETELDDDGDFGDCQ